MKKIVITGAAGNIGIMLRKRFLALGYEICAIDIDPFEPFSDNEKVYVLNVQHESALAQAVRGYEILIHLAGILQEDKWANILQSNIDGTYRVFEAARRMKIPKVIFASSNHVTGFYPKSEKIDVDVPPRPDTLYGVSKAAGEALGRYYADNYNLSVACLRIGAYEEQPSNRCHLDMWISPDDLFELVCCCIKKDYHYVVVYGVSANKDNWWINSAAEKLGFYPKDNSEGFKEKIKSHEIKDPVAKQFQGINFASRGFEGDIEAIKNSEGGN